MGNHRFCEDSQREGIPGDPSSSQIGSILEESMMRKEEKTRVASSVLFWDDSRGSSNS